MAKKRRKTAKEFLADAWLDLKFKLIILGSVFIAFMIVLLLIVNDIQSDKEKLANKANKYETYIDQLLLKKYSIEELKKMSTDELKLAVDVVIDEENSRVVNSPKLNDFIIPVQDETYSTQFKLSREPKTQWTQEDIDQFWINLDTLDLNKLDEKNFEYLKARLKDIR
ncbi:MAG: hypothetical protein JXR64_00275 [Spirochaetales bacterium]|nr:hypothetical protein [Spirochaetales bacterium]